jgi:carbohydrate kinase (thermoresistant glucokinase family)
MSNRKAESIVQPVSVLVVMGVSGCGKSTVAPILSAQLGWEYVDGDEFHPRSNVEKMHRGTPLTDADRLPWLKAIAAWIDDKTQAGAHGIVTCSALKRSYRDILVGAHKDVRLVYLKGGEPLIAQRLSHRDHHFMPPTLLHSQFETLEEPGPDEHPIVVSIAPKPAEIASHIVEALRTS